MADPRKGVNKMGNKYFDLPVVHDWWKGCDSWGPGLRRKIWDQFIARKQGENGICRMIERRRNRSECIS